METQPLEIPLIQGADTKNDPKIVDTQRLLAIVNGTFDGRRTLRKRPGTLKLTNTKTSGSNLSAGGRALFSFGNQLVQLNAGITTGEVGQTYSYTPADQRLAPRGDAPLLRASVTPLLHNGTTRVFDADLGGSDSFELFAYSELTAPAVPTTVLFLSVMDPSTGAFYQNRTQLKSGLNSTYRPRVVGTVGIYYADVSASTIKFRAFTTSTPSAIGTEVAVLSNAGEFNACPRAAGGSLLCYRSTSTNRWNVSTVDAAGAVTSTRDFNAFGGHTPNGAVACLAELSNGRVGFAVGDSADGLLYYVLNSDLTLNSGGTVVDAAATAITRIAMGLSSSNQGQIAYESSAGVSTARVSSVASVTVAAALWAPSLYSSVQMGLVGQPFFGNDGGAVVPCVLVSGVQPTYFLARGQYSAHGRLLAGTAWANGATRGSRVPQARSTSVEGYEQHLLAGPQADRFSGTATPLGVCRVTVTTLKDTANPENLSAAALDGKTYVSGACPFFYDGTTMVEEGFHHYPEAPGVADSAAGSIPAGAYSWLSIFQWVDETGVRHRSASSVATAFTVGAGRRVNVTVGTLRMTERLASRGRGDAQILIFRTLLNAPGVFYRIPNGVLTYQPNDPTVASFVIEDNSTDASISANEAIVIPDSGGPLDALPLPPLSHLTTHQERLVGVSSEADELAYSSQRPSNGTAVFSDTAFRLHVPSEGGPLVACASLDDKLLVFRRTKRYVIFGEGPNVLGNEGTYTDAQPQPDDVGCVDANSVVSTPAGVIFRSLKGYHLADRSLGIQYVGADVEAYNATAVRRAVLVPTRNHVRFILTDGSVLVFNYEVGQWARWTGITYVDACVWDDNVAMLKESGQINVETPLWFEDEAVAGVGGTPYTFSFDTAWLKVAGVAGFQRLQWVTLVGDGVTLKAGGSTAPVSVSCLYDFDDNVAVVDVVAGSVALSELSTYPAPVLLRHKPARQKCTAIKLRFSDTDGASAVADERTQLGFALVRLEIGVKRGSAKLPATRTV